MSTVPGYQRLTFLAISVPRVELAADRNPCFVDAYTIRSLIFDPDGQVYMKTMGDCSAASWAWEYLKNEYRGSVAEMVDGNLSASVELFSASSIVSVATLIFYSFASVNPLYCPHGMAV